MFDLTTARLIERKILLPGVTVLTRLIARVRDRAASRLWRVLAALPSADQQGRLEALLVVKDGNRVSPLDRLRRAPTRISSPAMVDALNRLTELRSVGVSRLDMARLPSGRVKALARYAAAAWAANIARMPPERRVATLVAFAHLFEIVAQDDAVDLLNQLITKCMARAEQTGEQMRLRTIHHLDAAAIRLNIVCKVVLDPLCEDGKLRSIIFERTAREQLERDSTTIDRLTRPEDDNYYEFLLGNCATIRRFLPLLLRTVQFEAAKACEPALKAIEFLRDIEGDSKPAMSEAPREVLNRAWQKLVIRPDGALDRRFYTFCVLERLQDGLARRDIFVNPSERWCNPRAKLLHGAGWEALRPQVCRTLDLASTAQPAMEKLGVQLNEAYHRAAANLSTNPDVRIEQVNGKDRLTLTGLDKLDEPSSLIALRGQIDSLLPRTDLTDAILEIHGYTGFAEEFTHISQNNARVDNLVLSICAVLAAEACNIGIEPLVDPEDPALSYARLAWVQQNYIRAETLSRANACLVDAQSRIPLAQAFGGGEVASADGLRFVVPVRTLNAGPNSRYFHDERGVTYYNFTSNQFSGFHGIVIPGTLHDSPYVLDGLMENQFLRVAGSLKMGKLSASELIRALQRGSKRSLLARALGELGRIPKTLHLLTFIDDPCYRRGILTQLNRGEGRHRLARKCFHGQRGELRQRYREGQEDQLGALGLVVNALVLWNTRYMDAALSQLRSQGAEVKPEDVARLSPLADKHFNVLGRYHFTVNDSILRGDLRPLRDPNAPEELVWAAGP